MRGAQEGVRVRVSARRDAVAGGEGAVVLQCRVGAN